MVNSFVIDLLGKLRWMSLGDEPAAEGLAKALSRWAPFFRGQPCGCGVQRCGCVKIALTMHTSLGVLKTKGYPGKKRTDIH